MLPRDAGAGAGRAHRPVQVPSSCRLLVDRVTPNLKIAEYKNKDALGRLCQNRLLRGGRCWWSEMLLPSAR